MTKTLYDLKVGERGTVIELYQGYQFLHRMSALGIFVDKEIEVISRQPLGGPLTIRVGTSDVSIGQGMAKKIYIK